MGRSAAGIVLAALALAAAVPSAIAAPVPRPEHPNILLVVTDDQRAYGTMRAMPQTRSWLARGGTRFAPAYATTPLCCPSRASILSGRYAHNHGVLFNDTGTATLNHHHSVQRYLSRAGYHTALIGRYMNNWPNDEPPPFFNEYHRLLFGEPIFGGHRLGTWSINGRTEVVPDYTTSYIERQALGFLHRANDGDDEEPWFLHLTPSAPHAPLVPEERYADAPVGPLPASPAAEEADLSDKPPSLQRLVAEHPEARGQGAEVRAGQLRMLMSVDDMMGALRQALEATGELADTLVIFMSDNGLLWGEHGGLTIKDLPYPPSSRIPLLASWPGHIGPNRTDRRMAANIDIAPTILDAAGVGAPQRLMDGRSLLQPWRRRHLLLEYFGLGDRIPAWKGLVTRGWQYTEYAEPEGTFREFYGWGTDPFELENPFGNETPEDDPANAGELAALLADAADCRRRNCP